MHTIHGYQGALQFLIFTHFDWISIAFLFKFSGPLRAPLVRFPYDPIILSTLLVPFFPYIWTLDHHVCDSKKTLEIKCFSTGNHLCPDFEARTIF